MVGTRVSHYRITGRLGEGGMGVVYEAVDEKLGRRVALKFPSGDAASSRQLADEARAASQFNHPNVAQIYEFGETPETGPFIAMELVKGRTLHAMIAAGRLPPEETVRIVRAIAQALEEADRHNLLHLDIKPSNVAVDERGTVKVLDFGLAKLLPGARLESGDDPRTKTLTGVIRGTPCYMSPEQARGEPLDARSDLFALGAVMYECLTARRAFAGASAVGALLEVVSTDPAPPSAIVPGIPQHLDGVVQRLLAKNREARHGSAKELIADLDAGPAVARRPLPRLAFGALLVLIVVASVWFISWKRFRADKLVARQVVVLPFENLSHQPEQAAFCDGLTEIVTGILGQPGVFSDALWVVPSSDVRRYGVETVTSARRLLHADLAIGGSVQRPPGAPAWLITISASDAVNLHVLRSQYIQVEERDAANINASLTAILVALLDVHTRPTTKQAQPGAVDYSRFVAARGYLRQYDRGDNLSRAVKELEAITTSTPDYAPAQVALAEAYYRTYSSTKKQEWLAKADQAVRRGAEINQNEPGIPLMLGRILRATGQFDAAIRELQAATARDPDDLPTLLLLAGAYQDAKRPADAETIYQQAIRLRPSYVLAYNNLGVFYMSQAKWKEAEEQFILVTKLAPGLADGYTNLGSLEYYLDHWDEALRLFSRSVELKPTFKAYADRCGLEFFQKSMDAAVADCRKAVEMQPADPTGWGNLADALFERGSLEDAAQAYRRGLDEGNKLLAINPTNPDLRSIMAKYAIRTGQKKKALELAVSALQQGKSVDVLYNTGKAYGLAGECARAIELLRQAFDKGYPRQVARRDQDLDRLRATPLACAVPPLN